MIGYVIAGLSGLLLLAFVTAIPRLLKRRGLEGKRSIRWRSGKAL